MSLFVLFSLVLAFVGVSNCGCYVHVDDLDLRVVSQLRFEVRNLEDKQCESFWRGLSSKLDNEGRANLNREETLEKLRQRLVGRNAFVDLLEFINKCLSIENTIGKQEEKSKAGSEARDETAEQNLKEELERMKKELKEQRAESDRLRAESDGLKDKVVELEKKQTNPVFKSNGDEVIVLSSYMNPEMQTDAINTAKQALERTGSWNGAARLIREEFNQKYQSTWQCALGSPISSSVAFTGKDYILFTIGGVDILLFRFND